MFAPTRTASVAFAAPRVCDVAPARYADDGAAFRRRCRGIASATRLHRESTVINNGWRAVACFLAAVFAHGTARAQAVAWTAPIEAYTNVESFLLDTATAPDGATAMLLQGRGSREDLRVVLYAAAAAAVWQAAFPPDCRSPTATGYGHRAALAFGADGDVYVAANSGFSAAQCVLRLARADGALVWRHHEARGDAQPLRGYGALAFDPAGNVLVAGERDGGAGVRLTRLDGSTGAMQWFYEPAAGTGQTFGAGYGLAVDALGNAHLVAATRPVEAPFTGSVVVAVRVDDAGVATWRQVLSPNVPTGICADMNAPAVALLDGATLVVGANCTNVMVEPAQRQFVSRLDAATGGVAWLREGAGGLSAVFAGPAGELVATGAFDETSGVRRFDPVSGSPLWTAGPAYPGLHFVGNGKALLAFVTSTSTAVDSLRTRELDLAAGTLGSETILDDGVYLRGWALTGNAAKASVVRIASRVVPGSWPAQTVATTIYTGTTAGTTSSAPVLSTRHTAYATPWRRAIAVAGTHVVSAANVPEGQFAAAAGAILVKRDTVTGAERWRRVYDRDSPHTSSINGVAGLPGGDIAFIGSPDVLTLLDGADGQTRWRLPMPAAYRRVDVIEADPAGDLVVLAWGSNVEKTWIAKYAAADGTERWRVELPPGGAYASQNGQVRFAANGDVFVVSFRNDAQQQPHFYAAKLRGTDGGTLWRTEFDTAVPNAQTVDAATLGVDLVVAGFRGEAAWSARLDGANGSVRWSVEHAALQRASRVLVDADGGIVLTAGYATPSSTHGWRIARLAAADGALAWYRELPLLPTIDAIFDLAQAPDGTLLFSGDCATTALCIAGVSPQDGTDRWWFSQPLVGGSTGTRIVQGLAFDARGNLVVNAYANTASTPDDGVTAAQMRVLGPWSQDLFADGFE